MSAPRIVSKKVSSSKPLSTDSNNIPKSMKRKREQIQDEYLEEVEEVEKALKLYHQGWITRKQLAAVIKVPIKNLNTWLVKKIQSDAEKLISMVNEFIRNRSFSAKLKNLEPCNDSDSADSSSSPAKKRRFEDEAALALYHQRRINRKELALRLKVPSVLLDDYIAMKIKRGVEDFSAQTKLLLVRSASTGWSVKDQQPADDSRESSSFSDSSSSSSSSSDSSDSEAPATFNKTNNNSIQQNNNAVPSDKIKKEKREFKKQKFFHAVSERLKEFIRD